MGFDEKVELYVQSDPAINAYALHALGPETPHVVCVTSGMVERMMDDEMRFCLGHEIGLLAFRQYRARFAYQALGDDAHGQPRMPRLLRVRLTSWNRLAELSTDRAGFSAVGGDLDIIASTFFKLQSGLGPEPLRFDIRAFLNQLATLEHMKRREVVAAFSHPGHPSVSGHCSSLAKQGSTRLCKLAQAGDFRHIPSSKTKNIRPKRSKWPPIPDNLPFFLCPAMS